MKKITLKCFLNENPKLFADTQPNEGPTFAHVADLLLEDVVAALVHVRAQKVLEAVVDLQAGGGHGHPLPHRVTLTRKRRKVSALKASGRDGRRRNSPSCPPGSRYSQSFPHRLPRSCPPPHARPAAAAAPPDARRPRLRCLRKPNKDPDKIMRARIVKVFQAYHKVALNSLIKSSKCFDKVTRTYKQLLPICSSALPQKKN